MSMYRRMKKDRRVYVKNEKGWKSMYSRMKKDR